MTDKEKEVEEPVVAYLSEEDMLDLDFSNLGPKPKDESST